MTEGLWELDEFRAAELDRYDALRSAAIRDVQRRAEADLLDAIADALVEFVISCPDAPRVGK